MFVKNGLYFIGLVVFGVDGSGKNRTTTNRAIVAYMDNLLSSRASEGETGALAQQMLNAFNAQYSKHRASFPLSVKTWFKQNYMRKSRAGRKHFIIDPRSAPVGSPLGCDGDNPIKCGDTFLDLSALDNYGCWCFFNDETVQSGRGEPINVIDQACQSLQLCRRCTQLDAKSEEGRCDGTDRVYVSPSERSMLGPSNDIATVCAENNPDPCAFRECCCEVQFAQTMMDLFFGGVMFDPIGKHDQGFVWEEQCKAAKGGRSGEVKCCGAYPKRVPYSTRNRDCCNNVVFDMRDTMCCADGTIREDC